jgi:hypothetical protein
MMESAAFLLITPTASQAFVIGQVRKLRYAALPSFFTSHASPLRDDLGARVNASVVLLSDQHGPGHPGGLVGHSHDALVEATTLDNGLEAPRTESLFVFKRNATARAPCTSCRSK